MGSSAEGTRGMSGNVTVRGGMGWLALAIMYALIVFELDIRCVLGNQPACEKAAEYMAEDKEPKS
jgi:hypothetical protein